MGHQRLFPRASNRAMTLRNVKTDVLRLAYEVSGPERGETLLLLHGWPDSPRTWDKILPALHGAGYRTVAPYLRAYGPSSFRDRLLSRNPRRTGQPVAFAQDAIDLADRLGLGRFHFIGHDWGARTGYALAACFPDRLKSLVAVAVPFAPGKATAPEFPQAHAYWYQWLLCSKPGEQKFRADPVAFGRAMWDSWSPRGWYTEGEFAAASKSWAGTDFEDVVLHSYRSRWGHAELDPAYTKLQGRLDATGTLGTPTLLLHGTDDSCLLTETTTPAARYFTGPYRRQLVAGAGHFPQREKPDVVSSAILEHLHTNRS